ncbi:MAG TPA: arginase family protein [Gaiellaceae bacterium]|nr:arginase family protein [Gaiellaceae bacterium]
MSRLRARCPVCGTLTAVAIGPDYECHVCGREFAAGLVRVPRAWGAGGDELADGARLPLPYPEASVVAEATLGAQTLALASELPERPLVLGGCCCAHIGAVEGLASRHDRIAVVWLDAHGDLNTPESSPSGNPWGMPLRMLIDSGAVAAGDVCLVGARDLDPPEEEFIAASGLRLDEDGLAGALAGADGVYVALDCDALDEAEVASFMPEPGGLAVAEVEALFRGLAARADVLGAGISGLLPDERNLAPLQRLLVALGL